MNECKAWPGFCDRCGKPFRYQGRTSAHCNTCRFAAGAVGLASRRAHDELVAAARAASSAAGGAA